MYKIRRKQTLYYYKDNRKTILHREDGPAVEHHLTKEWYLNGKLHREDGPAIEYYNGDKEWWLNGKVHREDGPAVECSDGNKSWYFNGIKYDNIKSLGDWEKIVKTFLFI